MKEITWLVVLLILVSGAFFVEIWYEKTNCSKPTQPTYTEEVNSVEPTYDDLLDAIEWVESKGIETAVGLNGEIGAYQIKPIYLEDYYRITGERGRFKCDPRYDIFLSRVITRTVTQHYAHATWPELDINDPQFLETAARSHKMPSKRTSHETDEYWEEVKAVLYNATDVKGM